MATGTTYIPPLLLEAGLEEQFMTMVLGVGPVLGLIFVPLIGSASDRWSGPFGRRRPFIWPLCLGVLLSLLLIPRTSHLAGLVAKHPRWLEVLLLVLCICLLEFCGQACFTPLEALVSDLFPGEEDNRRAFSIYSLMISIGGCVGYLLPVVDWHAETLTSVLGGQETFIYTLLTVIFLLCLLSTVFISERHGVVGPTPKQDLTPDFGPTSKVRQCCPRFFLPAPQYMFSSLKGYLSLLPRLHQLCLRTPLVIRRLFVAELCSWMALMTFMLFYTDFVGEGLYHGVPTAQPGTQERLRYDDGVRMGSLGLFLQCVASVIFSLLMDRLVARMGTRAVYLSSIVVLTSSTLVMSVSSNIFLVTFMAMITGYTFCTLQVLPYTLTCLYHTEKSVFFPSSKSRDPSDDGKTMVLQMNPPPSPDYQHYSTGHPGGMPGLGLAQLDHVAASPGGLYAPFPPEAGPLLPLPSAPRGLCLDMAILDSAYLLSQVVPSLFMGFIVRLTRSVTAYMACASGFGLLAMYFSRRVVFDRSDLE
ncbi:solute carrier family 45 member 3-like [Scleropages formosus]|nr:solute carrier family 45 member 3-like [Scleropages formosus]